MPKDHEKSKHAEEKTLPNDLGELILDHAKVKYSLIPLASVVARELKATEEFRTRPTSDLLEAAIRDVVAGNTTWDSLKKGGKHPHLDEDKPKEKK